MAQVFRLEQQWLDKKKHELHMGQGTPQQGEVKNVDTAMDAVAGEARSLAAG